MPQPELSSAPANQPGPSDLHSGHSESQPVPPPQPVNYFQPTTGQPSPDLPVENQNQMANLKGEPPQANFQHYSVLGSSNQNYPANQAVNPVQNFDQNQSDEPAGRAPLRAAQFQPEPRLETEPVAIDNNRPSVRPKAERSSRPPLEAKRPGIRDPNSKAPITPHYTDPTPSNKVPNPQPVIPEPVQAQPEPIEPEIVEEIEPEPVSSIQNKQPSIQPNFQQPPVTQPANRLGQFSQSNRSLNNIEPPVQQQLPVQQQQFQQQPVNSQFQPQQSIVGVIPSATINPTVVGQQQFQQPQISAQNGLPQQNFQQQQQQLQQPGMQQNLQQQPVLQQNFQQQPVSQQNFQQQPVSQQNFQQPVLQQNVQQPGMQQPQNLQQQNVQQPNLPQQNLPQQNMQQQNLQQQNLQQQQQMMMQPPVQQQPMHSYGQPMPPYGGMPPMPYPQPYIDQSGRVTPGGSYMMNQSFPMQPERPGSRAGSVMSGDHHSG